MYDKFRLKPEELTSPCNVKDFTFETTSDLTPLKGIIGQERAVEALNFGLRMKKKGYNIYIAGLSGTGRSSYSNSITERLAEEMPKPNDWVYVYNFNNADRPKALCMEPGLGIQFKKDIESMIELLQKEIPVVFGGTEYETKRNEVFREFQKKNQDLILKLNEVAKKHSFMFKESEHGLVTIPLKEGRPMTQEEYGNLSEEEMEVLRDNSNELSIDTLEIFNKLKQLEEQLRDRIKKLDETVGYGVINYYINKLLQRYGHREKIVEYINELEEDIVENIDKFKKNTETDTVPNLLMMQMKSEEGFLNRYMVNLFINNSDLDKAPIINESNPTFYNLIGTIEYKMRWGFIRLILCKLSQGLCTLLMEAS